MDFKYVFNIKKLQRATFDFYVKKILLFGAKHTLLNFQKLKSSLKSVNIK